MKINIKYLSLLFSTISAIAIVGMVLNAQEVFKSGQLYYTVTDPVKKTVMVVPENWSNPSNPTAFKLNLQFQVTNIADGQTNDSIIVELYSSEHDRAIGKNVLSSKKTNDSGIVVFHANDFKSSSANPNNGYYYINVFKGEMRAQATTVYLDFSLDQTINQNLTLENASAEPITVKVAIVYENFVIPQTGYRINRSFNWMNPIRLCETYKEAMEEAAHGVVNYEIVQEIDADTTFTYYTANNPNKTPMSRYEVGRRLSDRDTWKDFEASTRYNYNKMISYYGFDKMRDNEEVHEVWVATQPFSGMWESHLMGKNAFWLNSPPAENPTCDKLLTVMFFNYERSTAEAVHSFGHRFESVMMQVYGWWNYKNKSTISQLTNFELFTAHQLEYQKFDPSCQSGGQCHAHTGVCHYPPNGESDYDYRNKREVYSYAKAWHNYPYIREDQDLVETVSCDTWDCDHLKYLKWWYSHIPRFEGLNKKDSKLNNWWHYVVNYNDAIEKELQLRNQ